MRLRSSLAEVVPDRVFAKVEAHDVDDGGSMRISAQDLNLRSHSNLPWLDHREVKSASPTHQEALDHVVTVKSESQFVKPWRCESDVSSALLVLRVSFVKPS